MNMNDDHKKYLHWGLTCFLTACAIMLFYYLIFHGATVVSLIKSLFRIIMPIVDGFVLAYLISPMVNSLERVVYSTPWFNKRFLTDENGNEKKGPARGKVKRRVRIFAIVVVYIIVLTLVYLLFKQLIPELLSSIQSIARQLPDYWKNLQISVDKLFERYPELGDNVKQLADRYATDIDSWMSDWVNDNVLAKVEGAVNNITTGALSFLKALVNIVVGIIVSIHLVNGKELFIGQCKKAIYALMPQERANRFLAVLRSTNLTFLSFFGGKIVDSIIIGVLCFILTSIIGTPYGALISVIVGVTNIIPYFGPFIGAIPSAFLVLLVDPRQCLYFIIMILILQQFDGNILGPLILGQTTGLSSFWVIFSITLFGGLFGFVGMLVGVPIFAVLYSGVSSYINARLQEKHLNTDSKQYVHLKAYGEDGEIQKLSKEDRRESKLMQDWKRLQARFRRPPRQTDEAQTEDTHKDDAHKDG